MAELSKPNCNTDQYDNNGKCCTRCPKGTYVSTHCNNGTQSKCQTCPHNTYMSQSNGLHSCLSCRHCDSNNHQRVLKPCHAEDDRQCTCEAGYYCLHEITHSCQHCRQITTCPPGQGVYSKFTSSKDTECKPCVSGTFNNVTDYHTPCRNHTSCEKLGRYLVTPGTPSADAVCGEFLKRCHYQWMSGGLGVLLLLTVLICAGLLYWFVKHKRPKPVSVYSLSTTISPHSDNPPVLPPDIIHLPKYADTDEPRKDQPMLLSNSITTTTMAICEKNEHLLIPDYSVIDTPIFHSEPQEDEWPSL